MFFGDAGGGACLWGGAALESASGGFQGGGRPLTDSFGLPGGRSSSGERFAGVEPLSNDYVGDPRGAE